MFGLLVNKFTFYHLLLSFIHEGTDAGLKVFTKATFPLSNILTLLNFI